MTTVASSAWPSWVLCLALTASAIGCGLDLEQARRELASASPMARAETLRRLGESGDRRAAEIIGDHLRDPSPRVRQSGLGALALLGPDAVAERLGSIIGRLSDGDLEVRLAAVRLLGETPRPTSQAALLSAMRDASPLIRQAAAAALSAQGLDEARQARRLADHELEELVLQLRHPDEENRAAAARLLGLTGRSEAVAPLLALLQAAPARVVASAARALGRLGGPAAQQGLLRLGRSSSPSDRVAAAHGLGEMASPGGLSLLVQLGEDPSADVRRAALRAWARRRELPRAPSDRAAICGRLLDTDPRVLLAAAQLMRRLSLACPGELSSLVPGIDRPAVWKALALLDGAEVTSALLTEARRRYRSYLELTGHWITPRVWAELDEGVPGPAQAPPADERTAPAVALERLLRRFPERRGREESDPLLPPGVDRPSMIEAIRALAGRGEARRWLIQLAAEPEAEPEVRAAALRALVPTPTAARPLAEPAAVPAPDEATVRGLVLSALRAESVALKRAALESCGLAGAAAAPAALELLGARDPELRSAAVRCAAALREQRAVPLLMTLLRRGHDVDVIRALGQIGDRRAVDSLRRALEQETPGDSFGSQQVLLEALGALGDAAAAPAIERQLSHPDYRVRAAAARALLHAGRSGSRSALSRCTGDLYRAVRQACAQALGALR